MGDYCTASELAARLDPTGSTPTTAESAAMTMAIGAACSWINARCARRFDTATETRYFTAEAWDECTVDDLISVTSLATDETGARAYDVAWTSGDYELEPANSALASYPYTRVHTKPMGARAFSTLPRAVKVVGSFGWPATPAAVKEATLLMAARLYERRNSPLGEIGRASCRERVSSPV